MAEERTPKTSSDDFYYSHFMEIDERQLESKDEQGIALLSKTAMKLPGESLPALLKFIYLDGAISYHYLRKSLEGEKVLVQIPVPVPIAADGHNPLLDELNALSGKNGCQYILRDSHIGRAITSAITGIFYRTHKTLSREFDTLLVPNNAPPAIIHRLYLSQINAGWQTLDTSLDISLNDNLTHEKIINQIIAIDQRMSMISLRIDSIKQEMDESKNEDEGLKNLESQLRNESTQLSQQKKRLRKKLESLFRTPTLVKVAHPDPKQDVYYVWGLGGKGETKLAEINLDHIIKLTNTLSREGINIDDHTREAYLEALSELNFKQDFIDISSTTDAPRILSLVKLADNYSILPRLLDKHLPTLFSTFRALPNLLSSPSRNHGSKRALLNAFLTFSEELHDYFTAKGERDPGKAAKSIVFSGNLPQGTSLEELDTYRDIVTIISRITSNISETARGVSSKNDKKKPEKALRITSCLKMGTDFLQGLLNAQQAPSEETARQFKEQIEQPQDEGSYIEQITGAYAQAKQERNLHLVSSFTTHLPLLIAAINKQNSDEIIEAFLALSKTLNFQKLQQIDIDNLLGNQEITTVKIVNHAHCKEIIAQLEIAFKSVCTNKQQEAVAQGNYNALTPLQDFRRTASSIGTLLVTIMDTQPNKHIPPKEILEEAKEEVEEVEEVSASMLEKSLQDKSHDIIGHEATIQKNANKAFGKVLAELIDPLCEALTTGTPKAMIEAFLAFAKKQSFQQIEQSQFRSLFTALRQNEDGQRILNVIQQLKKEREKYEETLLSLLQALNNLKQELGKKGDRRSQEAIDQFKDIIINITDLLEEPINYQQFGDYAWIELLVKTKPYTTTRIIATHMSPFSPPPPRDPSDRSDPTHRRRNGPNANGGEDTAESSRGGSPIQRQLSNMVEPFPPNKPKNTFRDRKYYLSWGIYYFLFLPLIVQEISPLPNRPILKAIFFPILLVFAPNKLMEQAEWQDKKMLAVILHLIAWTTLAFFIPTWLGISSKFIDISFLSSFIPDVSAFLGLPPLPFFFMAATFLYLGLAQIFYALLQQNYLFQKPDDDVYLAEDEAHIYQGQQLAPKGALLPQPQLQDQLQSASDPPAVNQARVKIQTEPAPPVSSTLASPKGPNGKGKHHRSRSRSVVDSTLGGQIPPLIVAPDRDNLWGTSPGRQAPNAVLFPEPGTPRATTPPPPIEVISEGASNQPVVEERERNENGMPASL